MITNAASGTRIDEIAAGIYRISTPVKDLGGFSFNQYLVVDESPLLFHTGPRRMFPLTREAIGKVMPVERLRYVGLSHFEADECGALNEFLAVAPAAVPVCCQVAAMVSVGDVADRPPRVRRSSGWRRWNRPRLPACTAAPGGGMGPGSCARSRARSRSRFAADVFLVTKSYPDDATSGCRRAQKAASGASLA